MKCQITILLMMICLGNSYCQTQLGLKFGYNLSQPKKGKNKIENIPGYVGFKEFNGMHLGLISNTKLNNKFNLYSDLVYIAKGFDSRPIHTSAVLENTIALTVGADYELLPKLYILAGIEVDYILSRYWVNGFEFRNLKSRIPSSPMNDARNLNLGPLLSLKYAFTKRWSIEFRYVRIFSETPPELKRVFSRTYMFSLSRYF